MVLNDMFVYMIFAVGGLCVLIGIAIPKLVPASLLITTGVAVVIITYIAITPKSEIINEAHAEAKEQSGVIQSLNYDQETKGVLMVVDGEPLDIHVQTNNRIKLVDNSRNLYNYVKPEVGATVEYKQFEVDGETYTDAIGYQPVVNTTPENTEK